MNLNKKGLSAVELYEEAEKESVQHTLYVILVFALFITTVVAGGQKATPEWFKWFLIVQLFAHMFCIAITGCLVEDKKRLARKNFGSNAEEHF